MKPVIMWALIHPCGTLASDFVRPTRDEVIGLCAPNATTRDAREAHANYLIENGYRIAKVEVREVEQ